MATPANHTDDMDKAIGDENCIQFKVSEGAGRETTLETTRQAIKGMSDKSLLEMIENLRKENPAKADEIAAQFLEENSGFKAIRKGDGSILVQSVKNPDAPEESPTELLLFSLRSKIRRLKR